MTTADALPPARNMSWHARIGWTLVAILCLGIAAYSSKYLLQPATDAGAGARQSARRAVAAHPHRGRGHRPGRRLVPVPAGPAPRRQAAASLDGTALCRGMPGRRDGGVGPRARLLRRSDRDDRVRQPGHPLDRLQHPGLARGRAGPHPRASPLDDPFLGPDPRPPSPCGIYLPLVEVFDLPFLPWYRAISFLAWVPNLMVAELWLRRRARRV